VNLNPKKIQLQISHINASVAIQDQLKTIEVSALMIIFCTCISFFCHVYMKFPFKIKDSTFFLIVLEKYRNIGSLDTLQLPPKNDEHMQIPQASSDTSEEKAKTSTYNTNVTSVDTEQKAENSAMNVPSQHTTDMIILQNAFTDALSSMNKSQSALLQQLQINFSKSIENSLKTVIDNLKTQSHVQFSNSVIILVKKKTLNTINNLTLRSYETKSSNYKKKILYYGLKSMKKPS